ncbi:hypothetical protein [Mucilaginibacter sp. SG564]|uniref:hypothetical protein n=1 Tax=Mucilaginibacter sp. SG564 TaxID=2587022 RepID=UPI001551EA09|nr:hypothetical protein [Mucilaginibacter sp. SG564]NOW96434.1 uncharacterized membrane protein YtjA (UPF0391 family) [Mucilaginibacter sp. SG564]
MNSKTHQMKNIIIPVAIFMIATLFTSCTAIAGIFKAGAAVGILAVVIVIAVIIWIISLFRGKSN